MLKNIIKKVRYLFLIISITSIHSSIRPSWRTFLSDNSTTLYILTAAAACVIGKISYDLYQEYTWPNERVINNCRATYMAIYNDVQTYYNNYKNDAQLGDCELKEHIMRTKKPYSFMDYNNQIVFTLFRLIKHNFTIERELKRIGKRKKQLLNNRSEESVLFIEEFTQLETKGKELQKYIKKTCTLLSALKNRIALFQEYDNDYHNWSYTQQKNRDLMKYEMKQSLQLDKINCRPTIISTMWTKIRDALKIIVMPTCGV